VKAHDYLELMLDSTLQDERHRNERANTADFQDTQSSHDYQLQLYVSEFFMQSVTQALYWQGLLVLEP